MPRTLNSTHRNHFRLCLLRLPRVYPRSLLIFFWFLSSNRIPGLASQKRRLHRLPAIAIVYLRRLVSPFAARLSGKPSPPCLARLGVGGCWSHGLLRLPLQLLPRFAFSSCFLDFICPSRLETHAHLQARASEFTSTFREDHRQHSAGTPPARLERVSTRVEAGLGCLERLDWPLCDSLRWSGATWAGGSHGVATRCVTGIAKVEGKADDACS